MTFHKIKNEPNALDFIKCFAVAFQKFRHTCIFLISILKYLAPHLCNLS